MSISLAQYMARVDLYLAELSFAAPSPLSPEELAAAALMASRLWTRYVHLDLPTFAVSSGNFFKIVNFSIFFILPRVRADLKSFKLEGIITDDKVVKLLADIPVDASADLVIDIYANYVCDSLGALPYHHNPASLAKGRLIDDDGNFTFEVV